jgi:hypothetical protein
MPVENDESAETLARPSSSWNLFKKTKNYMRPIIEIMEGQNTWNPNKNK